MVPDHHLLKRGRYRSAINRHWINILILCEPAAMQRPCEIPNESNRSRGQNVGPSPS